MWAPVALVSALIFGIFGLTPATAIWLGMVSGFLGYELFHYRIHFARPICAFEEHMRTRHLAHHMRTPNQIFGVTNRIWDRVFGSEPDDAHLGEMQASVAMTAPADRANQLPSRVPSLDLCDALAHEAETSYFPARCQRLHLKDSLISLAYLASFGNFRLFSPRVPFFAGARSR